MLTLIKLTEADFLVTDIENDVYEEGDKEHAVDTLRNGGVDDEEIELALEELEANGDNRAYFGICGRMTHTENTGEMEAGVA